MRIITKVTGHAASVDQAADLRYLSETESRGRWGFEPLSGEGITALVGKPRRIFVAEDGGKFERLPAELLPNNKRTGTISAGYARQLQQLQVEGKIVAQRIVLGQMELTDNHGFRLAHERGTVVPLTLESRLRAQELGWDVALPAAAGRPILSQLLRENIRRYPLRRHAVRSMGSSKKSGKPIASHNVAVSPPLHLLERIRRAGQPVDVMLEVAARRAMEQLERKAGAMIVAVCSTHLEDSTTVRPHLHIRMCPHFTNGTYIKLYDSAAGAAGGGGRRCILQAEVERQIERIVERWEPPGRD